MHAEFLARLQLVFETKFLESAHPAFPRPHVLTKLALVAAHTDPAYDGRDGEHRCYLGRLWWPFRAFIDPLPQQTNLLAGQRVAFAGWRHLHVFNQMRHVVNQWTLGALSGNDINSDFAAFEGSLLTHQAEPALGPFRPVATPTGRFENR